MNALLQRYEQLATERRDAAIAAETDNKTTFAQYRELVFSYRRAYQQCVRAYKMAGQTFSFVHYPAVRTQKFAAFSF